METLSSLPDQEIEENILQQEQKDDKNTQDDELLIDNDSQGAKSEVDTILKFVEKKKQFIELERLEEAIQTEYAISRYPIKDLESKGLAMRNLIVDETSTGLYGRQIMTLSKNGSGADTELPTHRFSPGDIVSIMNKSIQVGSIDDKGVIRGIIYKVFSTKILVAISSKPLQLEPSNPNVSKKIIDQENDYMNIDFNGKIVTMIQVSNDTTFKRMEKSLKLLVDLHKQNALSESLKVLFHLENPSEIKIEGNLELKKQYSSAKLNKSQIEAILYALASKQLFLIHGPPGTGKTTTIVEYILQEVKENNKKVLVCAPSNVAVDNVLEKLSIATKTDANFKMVRVGHPARVLPQVMSYTIEEQYRRSNAYEVMQTIYDDMDKLAKEVKKASFSERRELRRNWNEMKRDLKRIESSCLKQVAKEANVVLATCTGADDRVLKEIDQFDVVVVDEAAQALDPIILISLLKAKKILLAGDHLQLPPTIKSAKASKLNLCTTTFFERCIRKYPTISRLLSVQYRMNDFIMKFSSMSLYKGKLTSHESVKDHQLNELVLKKEQQNEKSDKMKMEYSDYLNNPLVLVDTAGCSFNENGSQSESKFNEGEANVVFSIIQKLLQAGVMENEIGVISPYNAQVDLIRSKLRAQAIGSSIEVSSVDSFQGREKEVIIISLVRSNDHRQVGFLSSDQRTNVAITRARRLLMIVTDTETTSSHKFLKKLFDYCEKNGQYWSASEFEESYGAYSQQKPNKKLKKEMQQKKTQEKIQKHLKDMEDKNQMKKEQEKKQQQEEEKEKQQEKQQRQQQEEKEKQQEEKQRQQEKQQQQQEKQIDETKGSQVQQIDETIDSKVQESTQNSNINQIDETNEIKVSRNEPIDQSENVPTTIDSIFQNERKVTLENVSSGVLDYRAMQKAKYEQSKQKTSNQTSTSASPKADSKYASIPSSSTDKFGVQTDYFPQASMHPPKNQTAKKSYQSSSSSSSSGQKKPSAPVPIKESILKLDDDDEFLDKLIKENERCYMKGCKKTTKIISETCTICRHVYCLSHISKELHGCGEEAKRIGIAAAKKKAADLRIKASSPPVIDGTPKMKDWQKSVVQDKLQKKLEKQKEQRAKKPSAKK